MSTEIQPAPFDPALQEFRQQGAALVARERGLTAACRVKLASLARALHIPDDQVEAAIRSLGGQTPDAPPNPRAEKFRQRLRKDLTGKRSIIGPAIETQIVTAAAAKYDLDAEVARQVLAEVAAELKLRRITASDAMQSLADQVDEAAGDSTWLAREAWDRLRIAGGKWGVELEVVDELIEDRLATNRRERNKRLFWTRLTLGIAGGSVGLAGIVMLVLFLRHDAESSGASLAAPGSEPAAATTPKVKAPPSTPAWWDIDLAVDIASARTKQGGLEGNCDRMASSDAAERAAGYEGIVQLAAARPGDAALHEIVARIVAGCHSLEPDGDAATRLRQAIVGLLPSTGGALPADAADVVMRFWAAETAVAALHRAGASEERRQTMAGALSAALDASFVLSEPQPAHEELAREQTVRAFYRQLGQGAAKDPERVAALHPALRSRADRWLEPAERAAIEAAFLASALPTAGEHWQAYESAIVHTLSAGDSLAALQLVEALRRTKDPELFSHLAGLLLLKTGARPKTTDRVAVLRALRKALGSSASGGAADRWFELQEAAAPLLAAAEQPAPDAATSMQQTIALAHMATLAMALSQGEAGFAQFDVGIEAPPQWEAASALEAPSESSSEPPKPPERLSIPDQRLLNRYLETLTASHRNAAAQRANALRGLASLAPRVADLPQAQAEGAARYVLAGKEDEEFQILVTALHDLRRWKRLRLAVADLWPSAELPADKLVQVAEALGARGFSGTATPAELRHALLQDVLAELESTAKPSIRTVENGAQLDSAAEVLHEVYLQRARVHSAPSAELALATSPAQALVLSLRPVAEGLTGEHRAFVADLPKLQRAAEYVAAGDLQRTIAWQNLLVELSARRAVERLPQHAGAARQIAAETSAAMASAESALVQLRLQEAALLKLWMLYAPEA